MSEYSGGAVSTFLVVVVAAPKERREGKKQTQQACCFVVRPSRLQYSVLGWKLLRSLLLVLKNIRHHLSTDYLAALGATAMARLGDAVARCAIIAFLRTRRLKGGRTEWKFDSLFCNLVNVACYILRFPSPVLANRKRKHRPTFASFVDSLNWGCAIRYCRCCLVEVNWKMKDLGRIYVKNNPLRLFSQMRQVSAPRRHRRSGLLSPRHTTWRTETKHFNRGFKLIINAPKRKGKEITKMGLLSLCPVLLFSLPNFFLKSTCNLFAFYLYMAPQLFLLFSCFPLKRAHSRFLLSVPHPPFSSLR